MRLLAVGFGLLLLVPPGTAAPAKSGGNLLVNGSFEEGPDDIGEYKSLDKGATDIKVTEGLFTFVALDEQHRPRPVDP